MLQYYCNNQSYPYLRHVPDVFPFKRFDRYVARVEFTSADYAAQQCRFAASAGSQKSITESNKRIHVTTHTPRA